MRIDAEGFLSEDFDPLDVLLDAVLHLEMVRYFTEDPATVEPETELALDTLRRLFLEIKMERLFLSGPSLRSN